MKNKNYNRFIALACPACGNAEFPIRHDNESITCPVCDLVITKDELIQENNENISIHVDEIKKQITNDVKKHFTDELKKAFKGSKNIKFK